jgi:hypothetical protein
MTMCSNCKRQHFGERNDMFGGVGKNNQIWCCLEYLDLLFTKQRFVFFTLTTACIFSWSIVACY